MGMTLPCARDLAQTGIRVCAIAPGLFNVSASHVAYIFFNNNLLLVGYCCTHMYVSSLPCIFLRPLS